MNRIATVSAYDVRVPLPAPLALANQTIVARDYVVVEMTDDAGTVGRSIGYARGAPVSAVVERMLAPLWQGGDLGNIAALSDRTASVHSMQGTHGIFWRALSLVDCAAHDLASRRASQPLVEFLGGAIHPITTTLAGCYPVASETPDTIASLMATMLAYGSAGIKVTSSGDFAHDTKRLKACRAALGNGTPLIVDVYCCAPSAAALIPFAQQWADFGMGWVEDPFGFDDFDEVAALAAAIPYPVGVGDEQAGLAHFSNLIRHGRIGVVRLDATSCGGVTGFLRIAKLAERHGLPVSCHVFHHLHAQLAAIVENASIEYMLPQTGVDAIHLLVTEDLGWSGGRLVPSTAPGTGMIWDEVALRRFRV